MFLDDREERRLQPYDLVSAGRPCPSFPVLKRWWSSCERETSLDADGRVRQSQVSVRVLLDVHGFVVGAWDELVQLQSIR